MTLTTGVRLTAAVLLLWISGASAAPDSVPTPEAGANEVQARKVEAYRNVLASFDRALQAAPQDAALAVGRCRFIGQYVDDEYGDWVDTAPGEFEACRKGLTEHWKDAPVAQLYALRQLWGEEAVEAGEALVKQSARWPVALRGELLATVSAAQEEDNPARAGELAVQAVRLGDASRVADAVHHLASQGRHAEAARLLVAASPAEHQYAATARVKAALELPARDAALVELRRYAAADWKIDAVTAARAHLHAGDVAGARAVLKGATGDTAALRQVRFDVATASGDASAALAAIRFSDAADFTPNLQRFMTLAVQSPSTLVQAPMLVGLLLVAMIAIGLALVPGLLLVPVHYRGLVRRVGGRPAEPLFPVGLRSAWWAGAVVLAVPLLAGMVTDPSGIGAMFDGLTPGGPGMARMLFWGSSVGLLCLAPVLYRIGARRLIGDREAWRAARWRLPVACACVLGINVLIGVFHSLTGGGGETLQTRTIQAVASTGTEAYGPLATFLLMTLLVPVFEELVFRVVLLGGMARHIGFGWANTLQAVLFAFAHGDAPRFVFYLALALFCGWLVKHTRSAGPAIVVHALNNAFAFYLMLHR